MASFLAGLVFVFIVSWYRIHSKITWYFCSLFGVFCDTTDNVEVLYFYEMSLSLSISDVSLWLESGHNFGRHAREYWFVPFLVMLSFCEFSPLWSYLLCFSLLLTIICEEMLLYLYVNTIYFFIHPYFISFDSCLMNQLLLWQLIHGYLLIPYFLRHLLAFFCEDELSLLHLTSQPVSQLISHQCGLNDFYFVIWIIAYYFFFAQIVSYLASRSQL